MNSLFDDYDAFVEKFEPKRTTDDCYTPYKIYLEVVQWVDSNVCKLDGLNVVRPFWPGEEYQSREYAPSDVVIDNPPFSILSKIIRFYVDRGIRFFLFAPSLTLFGLLRNPSVSCVVASAPIVYANGAEVRTSFVTNMLPADVAFTLAPDLYQRLAAVSDELRKATKKKTTKHIYPLHVVSAAMLGKVVTRGVSWTVMRKDCRFISNLGGHKNNIYGGGLLLSSRAAAERAAVERAAVERAAAERAAAARAAAERAAAECAAAAKHELSAREISIIDAMDAANLSGGCS